MNSGPYTGYRDLFGCVICQRKKSARTRKFFARSRLILRQPITIVVNWVTKAPVTLTATTADVTKASAVHWYEYAEIYEL